MSHAPADDPGEALRREEQILHELLQTGRVRVDALTARLGVSPATVRRDLGALERRGLLRRTHGGAVPLQPLLYEPFRHDAAFHARVGRHADEKRRIALAAAALVGDGETIAVTAGTTTTQVTRNLHGRRGLTVVTNALNVGMELSTRPDVTVVVTGGVLRGGWFSLVGPAAAHAAGELFVDTAFVGVAGIHAERGLTTADADEAATVRAMMRQARRRVVVADHGKLGVLATALVCAAADVDVLITGAGAPDDAVAPFAARGIDVRRV